MFDPILLVPAPRELKKHPGHFTLAGASTAGDELARKVGVAATALKTKLGSGALPLGLLDSCITLKLDPQLQPERYKLLIQPSGIHLTGRDACAIFRGATTLVQLLRQFPQQPPALEIDDWPDFPVRGVMLDISRDKVPTMSTLYALVDQLAEWKVNQLQLYMEHTFAYADHREVWKDASPMTGPELLALDAYCRERFIELVPNQNSFGHMERWLRLPRYQSLAEAIGGSELPWGGRWEGPAGLCPGDPGSIQLLRSLYDELLPNFGSKLFNVGCDETWDLGQGRSAHDCEARGKGRVYLEFLLKIQKLVQERGQTMQFWGDIILHYPELIRELPRDVIALQWGYHADHPFDRDGKFFADAGIPFYVCPGTSTWQAFVARTDNALGNLASAACNGLKHGAIGYLNTDWGDMGHLQYQSASYLGFAAGAAFSWCLEKNRDLDPIAILNVHVFRDRAKVMGKLVYDLGNVYKIAPKILHGATQLFRILVPVPSEPVDPSQGMSRDHLNEAESAIMRIMRPLDRAQMDLPDAKLIADEFRNSAAIMLHACRVGRYHLDSSNDSPQEMAAALRTIIVEHRRLWIARNRIGGLADSAAKLEANLPRI